MNVDLSTISGMPHETYSNFSFNPVILFVIGIVLIIFVFIFSMISPSSSNTSYSNTNTNSMMTSNSSNTSFGSIFGSETSTIAIVLWTVFILIVLLNGAAYLFNVNIYGTLENIFSANPTLDLMVDPQSDLSGGWFGGGWDDWGGWGGGWGEWESGEFGRQIQNNYFDEFQDNYYEGPNPYYNEYGETQISTVPEGSIDQVFHIPNNLYTYNDSRAICSAYGGRLATIKELQDAYKDGADWCGYGWSDGQMALFPTQYEKWEKLQKIPGHQHDCGRPGINGGYIDNENIRYGINCYGKKPLITPQERYNMKNMPEFPLTNKEIAFNESVDYWRMQLPKLEVAPFSHNNWSVV